MIDEIVARIQEEDAREHKEHLERATETIQYIQEYIKQREVWKKEEKERQVAENKKIEEYAKLQAKREEERQEKKRAIENARGEIYERVSSDVFLCLCETFC